MVRLGPSGVEISPNPAQISASYDCFLRLLSHRCETVCGASGHLTNTASRTSFPIEILCPGLFLLEHFPLGNGRTGAIFPPDQAAIGAKIVALRKPRGLPAPPPVVPKTKWRLAEKTLKKTFTNQFRANRHDFGAYKAYVTKWPTLHKSVVPLVVPWKMVLFSLKITFRKSFSCRFIIVAMAAACNYVSAL